MSNVTEEEVIVFLKARREELLKELEKVETALNALGGLSIPANYFYEEPEIPNSYSEKLKMDKKILFALNQIGSGDKMDILAQLKILEPSLDVEKLEKSIAVRLSYLKNKNMIKWDKNGRSLTYHF
ncbi:hypothetical protein ACFOUP_12740 [Belliella kenyensis]|uniref:Uncharacterized protein n=2 Tax=Belliella TaxID=232244 RepID=A0ABS9V5V5_9BACT|nr:MULTISPECIES: hypothetical protein [Belliella]MCH7400841.1 hypothetical protein [Belliella kenyensis]MCH7411802.1 hypothetical protein [Belliella filtrata]MDN3601871.1 hypothetical protein [Belliella kenyensis]